MKTPKGKESVQSAPLKETESMQNVFFNCNIESQQFLYLEEILTKSLKEKWEGFDSQIKTWQKQRGYFKFRNT